MTLQQMIKAEKKAGAGNAYMSTLEVAGELGVAVRTVQLWVESGTLPAWKTAGGHRRIPRAAVEKLLAERRLASGEAADLPAAPFRVLVVEDDAALRRLFELSLGSLGLPLEIATADNGFAALLAIGERRPDLLITDLNMPGMDGFRMLGHLRESPQWHDLEVLVVTALGRAEVDSRGSLPDGVRVLGKPVPFAEIEALLRQRIAARAGAK